jgi:alanine racemase
VRIYVFEGALADTSGDLRTADIVPVLNHADQAAVWRRNGGGRPAAVHVDTGMHRLGFPADVTAEAFRGVAVTLLMTHLACADEPDHPMNAQQLQRLKPVQALFPGVPISVGNSAGVLSGPEFTGDLGRAGIGLYGGNPFRARPSPVHPVVTLEGRILQLRDLAPGEAVGYGATFRATSPMRIAVVGLGYGDGLPRLLSNRGEVALAGARCPIVGRVSMDLTAIDVTGKPALLDDWVEFIGPNVGVDEVADWADTIAYEVLTGLGRRPQRELVAG